MSPAQLSMVDLVERLNKIDGAFQVDVVLSELEKNVEDFKVTLEGYSLDYGEIREVVRDFGAVIRNVDHITSKKQHIPQQDDDHPF